MGKVVLKLLIVVVIAAAAFALDLKLDLFPSVAVSDEPEAVEKLDQLAPLEQLELQIAKEFEARSERFSVSYLGDKQQLSDNLTEVIRAALKHDDYSAYILESYIYTIRSWGTKSTIAIEARYRETLEQTSEVDREVAKALATIIKPSMNDHMKIKAIHDWIVSHVEYDQSLTLYTAYDAIRIGKAVCQGYSLLAYKMLKEAGINVLIAEGTVNTGEHAWNMVQLDGAWYHLDVTWDDPVSTADKVQSDATSVSSSNGIRYSYYLRSDEQLRVDHQWTKSYPAANSVYADVIQQLERQGTNAQQNSFGQLKLALGLHWLEPENTVSSTEQLSTVIREALGSRKTSLEFRFKAGEQFPDALKAAFEDVHIAVGYRASYEPFAGDESLIVRIQLEY